jgi:hypothetical protein
LGVGPRCLRLGARYGHVGLAVRRDREKSRLWLGRAEPPAGLARPGLGGRRLGRTSGPGYLFLRLGFLRLGVRLRGVPGSGLSRSGPGGDVSWCGQKRDVRLSKLPLSLRRIIRTGNTLLGGGLGGERRRSLGRVGPAVGSGRVGPIVVLGGTGPFGGIGPGGTGPLGGVGHAGFRVSIPGDVLAVASGGAPASGGAATGSGAQLLGEWPRAPVVGGG